jgi:hypothetical protein
MIVSKQAQQQSLHPPGLLGKHSTLHQGLLVLLPPLRWLWAAAGTPMGVI